MGNGTWPARIGGAGDLAAVQGSGSSYGRRSGLHGRGVDLRGLGNSFAIVGGSQEQSTYKYRSGAVPANPNEGLIIGKAAIGYYKTVCTPRAAAGAEQIRNND